MAAILEPLQRPPQGQPGLSVTDASAGASGRERERRLLQRVVAVAALVPIVGGLTGVLFGPSITGDQAGVSGDSHYRYLSGLLLGVGLLFWSTVPMIEDKTGRFRVLTLVVVAGGVGRLIGLGLTGVPSLAMIAALAMELVVTPALCLWQTRVANLIAEARTRSSPGEHPIS